MTMARVSDTEIRPTTILRHQHVDDGLADRKSGRERNA